LDFELNESQRKLVAMVRDFCVREVKPHAQEWDRDERFPREVVAQLGELGLLGMTVPEELGGSALDTVSVASVVEEVARWDGSLALTVASHNGLGTSHLLKFGSDDLRKRYIPDIVKTGDSRVLLIDGEPVPYALARIPTDNDNRGNLAAGAKGVGRPLNDRDRWLAGQIGPALAAKGMMFVGLDVIGDFVTEINVTSPTGIRELDKQFGLNIGDLLMQAIERRLKGRAPRL